MGGKRWTEKEENYIEDNWGIKSYKSIGRNIGRTASAVYERGRQLGLQGATLTSDLFNASQIARMLGIDVSVVIETFQKEGLKLKKKTLTKKQQKWYATHEDLLEFLEKNQRIWTTKNLKEYELGIEPEWLKEKRRRDRTVPCRNQYWTEDEDREALYLYYNKNLVYREIAKQMHRSLSAVANRIARLNKKKKLRRVV